MGASGWNYVVSGATDPAQSLSTLHSRVLADGSYYWLDDSVARPDSLGALHALYSDPDTEYLAEEGTHSILDIFRIGGESDPDDFGTIKPASIAERQQWFGTDKPTETDVARVMRAGQAMDFPRWSGRFTVYFDNDAPAGLAIWGYSGD